MTTPILASWVAILLIGTPAFAQQRIDASSSAGITRSIEALKKSLSPQEITQLQDDWRLINADLLCPMDQERPNLSAFMEFGHVLPATMNGKTVADIHALASRITTALDAERATMSELPVDSAEASVIRGAVEKYLNNAPEQAETYDRFFPFWTHARIAFAESLPAPTPPPHKRELTGMMLLKDGWMKSLPIAKIVASPKKAYVYLGIDPDLIRTVFLLDGDVWKAHADFIGYPWSREGSSAPECVGILEPRIGSKTAK